MKRRRGLGASVRVCPHCGKPYDRQRPLLRDDGVTTAYVHGDIVCISETEQALAEVYTAHGVYYETDD